MENVPLLKGFQVRSFFCWLTAQNAKFRIGEEILLDYNPAVRFQEIELEWG